MNGRRIAAVLTVLVAVVGCSAFARAADFDPRWCGYLDADASPWTVTADAVFLDRRDQRPDLLIANTANPAQNLNASSFQFDFETGVDLSVARRLGCYGGVEVRYLGVDQWNSATRVPTTAGDLLSVNTAVPIFVTAGTSIDAVYGSQLHNTEINGLYQLTDCFSVLAGFRYVELDEQFAATTVGAITPFGYVASTRNRLYGFQLGGQALLWEHDLFSIDAAGKAGIFSNQAAQDSVYASGVVTRSAAGRRDPTAFVGEIALTGRVKLTDCVSLRGGYRLLWIDGVALATDQVPATAFVAPGFAPGPGIAAFGDVFYHGAFAGLHAEW